MRRSRMLEKDVFYFKDGTVMIYHLTKPYKWEWYGKGRNEVEYGWFNVESASNECLFVERVKDYRGMPDRVKQALNQMKIYYISRYVQDLQ